MEKVFFRGATRQDAEFLSRALRREDVLELAAGGRSALAALLDGLFWPGAETYAAVHSPSGEPMAMFGAAPVSVAGGEAAVWLLGTRRIDECPFEYVRYGKKFLGYILTRYTRVFNYVDGRSRKSIRMLRILGFRFDPSRDVCTGSAVFRYFCMEA